MKTGLITSNAFLDHVTGVNHVEAPERITSILEQLKSSNLLDSLYEIQPATPSRLFPELVHESEYVDRVEKTCRNGDPYIDTLDNPICKNSYDVALLATSAVSVGVDWIFSGKIKNAMAILRPPGHHAEKDRAMGFCLFNNVSIAARYAQKEYKAEKILIIDFDVHHGNGTQHIFEEDSSVLYVSLHRYPFYPGTGSKDETGKGRGLGMTINYPLDAHTGDNNYLDIVNLSLSDKVLKFQPDFIILSSGFDAHEFDPLGGMDVTTQGYGALTEILVKFAEECCGGRILSVLEGGYNLKALAESVEIHLRKLSGIIN